MTEQNNNNEPTSRDILEAINEFSGRIEEKMATKDDLKLMETRLENKMATLENKMESGFARIELELEGIKQDLEEFSKRTKEDVDVLAGDYLKLKQRVEALEAQVKQMQLSQA